MFEKCDSPNRQKQMVASFSILARFTAKFELAFILTKEKAFSKRFRLKSNTRSTNYSKKTLPGAIV